MPPPRLLLVDDAPEMGVIVRSLARRAGCEVEVCRSAAEAWDRVVQHPPDLILLDVNLGGPSGLELCCRVRTAPSLREVPIALFGQWGLPGDVVAGLDAGVDFVFCKDLICRPRDWQQRLHEILTLPHGQTPPWSLRLSLGAKDPSTSADRWILIRRSLQHASIRWLGSDLIGAVARRALVRTFGPEPPSEWTIWLSPNDLAHAPPGLGSDVLATLSLALSEWFWRLLGTEASAPVRTLLAAAVPAGPTIPSP